MPARVIAPDNLRAGRLVRPARLLLAGLFLGVAPLAAASAQGTASAAVLAPSSSAGQTIADFYAERDGEPLWLRDSAAPAILLDYLRTADADGLDPTAYRLPQLEKVLRAARNGSQGAVRKADLLLSQAFVAFVRDQKRTRDTGMIWVDPKLKPQAPRARALLESAASAPSLEAWLAEMRWMNPIYAGLRKAMIEGRGDRQLLRLNLERARALPAGDERYIIVNATAQRLTAYENGRIVDSMKVVVGKPKNPTPMMAASIRFASLNPYWYVPPDLTAERIAPNVLKEGLTYLKTHGYQVLSNWYDGTTEVDPATIDWQAVADGTKEVFVRQMPGPGNAMGKMKFMFPNDQGVYLHDTPQKELLSEASRMFSGGCVRLEDAPRLGQWLFGKPLRASSRKAEIKVDLPEPVPVYITYLTLMPSGDELASFPDVYGRDRQELANIGRPMIAAASH